MVVGLAEMRSQEGEDLIRREEGVREVEDDQFVVGQRSKFYVSCRRSCSKAACLQ